MTTADSPGAADLPCAARTGLPGGAPLPDERQHGHERPGGTTQPAGQQHGELGELVHLCGGEELRLVGPEIRDSRNPESKGLFQDSMPAPRGGGPAGVLVITGTGTGVGKTVLTAAIAAVAAAGGLRVAVLKPAQTGVAAGEPGDAAEVARLAGIGTACELARYPDPLAPATAARLAGVPPVTPAAAARAARHLARDHDLVLVEGAGGLLVPFTDLASSDPVDSSSPNPDAQCGHTGHPRAYGGGTLVDVAAELGAPVLVVAAAGLGTLNATALTTEALRARGLRCAGVVIGAWPAEPDLACRCNLGDLPATCGEPIVGIVPDGAAALDRAAFAAMARSSLAPALGGTLDVTRFSARAAGLLPQRAAH